MCRYVNEGALHNHNLSHNDLNESLKRRTEAPGAVKVAIGDAPPCFD